MPGLHELLMLVGWAQGLGSVLCKFTEADSLLLSPTQHVSVQEKERGVRKLRQGHGPWRSCLSLSGLCGGGRACLHIHPREKALHGH